MEREVELHKQTVKAIEETVEKLQGQFAEKNQKVDEFEHELAQISDRVDQKQRECTVALKLYKTQEEEIKTNDKQLDTIKNDKINNDKVLADLKSDLMSQRRSKAAGDQKGQDNVVDREEQKKILEEELADIDVAIETLRKQNEEMGQRRDDNETREKNLTEELKDTERRIKNKKVEWSEYQGDVETSQRAANKRLGRFGKAMENCVRDIEKNKARFKHMPIGPLGQHISLKPEALDDNNLNSLIHVQLGVQLLRSFLVFSTEDRKLLGKIFANGNHFRPGQQPQITQKSLSKARHPVNKFSIPKQYKSMLDYLSFDNDQVFNTVIDQAKCESVLITDDATAQRLFLRKETVPANTRVAITTNFYKYNPPTRGNYSSSYIDRPRDMMNYLIPDRDLERQASQHEETFRSDMQKLQNSLKTIKMDINNARQDLNAVKREIQDGQVAIKCKRQRISEIKSLLNELNSNEGTIESLEQLIEERTKKAKELIDEDRQRRIKKREMDKKLNELRAKKEALDDEFNSVNETKEDLERKKSELVKLHKPLKKRIDDETAKLRKQKQKLDKLMR